jgi:hypothetical protein
LIAITSFLRRLRVPFLVYADWNVEPLMLAQSGWFDPLSGFVVVPTGATISCSSGRGSMLDYLLVSKSMIPRLRSVTMDLNSVWAPHCGLRVVVDATPCVVMVSKLWRLGAVPVGVVVDDKGRQKAASSTDGHWQQAQSWVGWQACGPPPRVLLGCLVTQLFGDEALVFGSAISCMVTAS